MLITIIVILVLVLQEGNPKAGQHQLERLRARLQRRTGRHHGCPVIKKLGNASRSIATTGTSKKKEEEEKVMYINDVAITEKRV